MRLNRPLAGLLLTLVLALGSAAQGFAYRYERPIRDPALLAYLQMGGSLDDLCSGGARHRGIPCPGCLIGPAILPAPLVLPHPAKTTLALSRPLGAPHAPLPAPRDPGHGVRAPPAAVAIA